MGNGGILVLRGRASEREERREGQRIIPLWHFSFKKMDIVLKLHFRRLYILKKVNNADI